MKKIAVLVLLVLASVAAYADMIDLAYVALEAGGNKNVNLNGTGYSGANGLMAVDTQNPVGPLANLINANTWAYCNDLGQHADFPFATYTVATLETDLGADKAGLISQLWAQNVDPAWMTDTYIYYGGNQGGWQAGQPANTAENQEALAMVLAIYEIRYDFTSSLGDLDLSAGAFKANSTNPASALSIAQGWLSALVMPADYNGPTAQLLSLTNAKLQDMIVEVPEPASMALLALGSLLLRKRG